MDPQGPYESSFRCLGKKEESTLGCPVSGRGTGLETLEEVRPGVRTSGPTTELHEDVQTWSEGPVTLRCVGLDLCRRRGRRTWRGPEEKEVGPRVCLSSQ